MGIKIKGADMDRIVQFFRMREQENENKKKLRRLWRLARFDGRYALVPAREFIQLMKVNGVVK